MRYFLLSLLFCLHLSGNETSVDHAFDRTVARPGQPSENLTCSPSDNSPCLMIENMVCPISGSLSLSDFDAQVVSLEPILIDRSYTSDLSNPNIVPLGWMGAYNGDVLVKTYRTFTKKQQPIDNYTSLYVGPYKQRLYFVSTKDGVANINDMYFNPEHFRMGMTNLGGQEISGRSNPKNTTLKMGNSKSELVLKTGGGMKVTLERYLNDGCMTGKWRARKHSMANGNKVRFTYDHKARLSEVKSFSCTDKNMASAKYNYSHNKLKIKLSNGAHVTYDYDDRHNLIGAYRSDASYTQYQYDDNRRLTKKTMADGRYLSFKYDWEGRVEQIFAPAWADGSSCPTHRMEYHVDKHNNTVTTGVRDPWNNYTVYISRDGKISEIKKKIQDKLYSTETLTWGQPETGDAGYLLERSLRQADNNLIYIKNYHYDDRGNPRLERLWGNLTGKSGNIWNVPGKIMVDLNQEHLQIVKTFTKKNLLAAEEDGQKRVEYSYHPNTDLISSRLTKVGGQVVERHFFEYDENNALIKEIEDDGSSESRQDINFSFRIIHNKIYSNSLTGLADSEEEKVFNLKTGQEDLVSRKQFKYDNRGRVLHEAVYDAAGKFAYDQSWEYDAYGSVTKEVNPLGGIILRTFDQNQNLINEIGPLFDHSKHYYYDCMNRLVRKEEWHGEEKLFTSYQYDPYGRITKETDTYGNETDFKYDAFGRLVETHYPVVYGEQGKSSRHSTSTTYDEQGFVKSTTDQAGNTVRFWNTIKGKPYAAYYPDGTKEHWHYDIYGNLVKHFSPNGLITAYENDWQGRPLVEMVYSQDQQLLYSKSIEYCGKLPAKIVDVDGSVMISEYDAAGRVILMEKEGVRTEFSYDDLGRLYEKTVGGISKTRFAYNILGQIVDEWNVDAEGNTTLQKHTEFDAGGRPILQNVGGVAVSITYNSKGEVVKTSAPEGRIQVTQVDHHFVNEFGQKIKRVTTVDTDGSYTEVEFNTLGQERKVTKKDAQGNVLQKGLKVYFPTGKLKKTIQTVIYQGKIERDFVVYFEYDQIGRPTSVVEAKDEPIQKTTRYTYNALGQKECFIKPDGVSIGYLYDELGRVKEEKSTDGTVHYEYCYDSLSRPVKVIDHVNSLTTEKTHNKFNHLTREKLGSGHVVEYGYDMLGRITEVRHEGSEKIELSYDSDFLRKVSWKGQTVTYGDYDAGGKLVEGDGITYRYDAAGRNLGWKKGNYSESCQYNRSDNIIRKELLGVKAEYEFDNLNQLQEEKGAQRVSYKSDSLYNRRQKNGSDHTLNALNQLLGYADSTYEWDRNGNMIAKTEEGVREQFIYDAKDRLIEVVGKAKYIWDDQNRRIFNNDQIGLYQGMNEVGIKVDGKIKEFRVLGLGKGSEIGAAVFVELKGALYKPLHDISGNMIALLTPENTLVESYEFTAYGEEVKGSILKNPWGFSSKRKDHETGFILFGHRFYHPPSGRFVTADPMGYSAGVNLYAYCNNSPLTHNDHYGLAAVPIGPQHESDTPDTAAKSSEPTHSAAEKVVSAVVKLFKNLFRDVKKVVNVVGTGVRTVSWHSLPNIPVVKDIALGVGVILSGVCTYTPTWSTQQSAWTYHEGKKDPNGIAVIDTGILTGNYDAKTVAAAYLKITGFECYVFTPGTHGAFSDVIASFLDKLGIHLACYKEFKRGMEVIVNRLEAHERIKLITHSRACILANNLSKDWKAQKNGFEQRVEWQAYAAPVVPDKNAFKTVDVIMSSRDIVCCLAGIGRWFPPSHVTIAPGRGVWGLDHMFMSPTYQYHFEKLNKPKGN